MCPPGFAPCPCQSGGGASHQSFTYFHPRLRQRSPASTGKHNGHLKKIANLALKLQGLKQPGPPPDLIGRVSLDIVALVCHVERHTVPRHTKLRRHVTRRGPRAAQPVHTFPQLDQLVSH